jgi:hypothetical protein
VGGGTRASYRLALFLTKDTCLAANKLTTLDEVQGDCGAWIIDAKDTDQIYGYVVASKEGTGIAYVVLLQDVFKDISTQLGKSEIGIPTESELESARDGFTSSRKATQSTSNDAYNPWLRSLVLTFGESYYPISVCKNGKFNPFDRRRRCTKLIVLIYSQTYHEARRTQRDSYE